MVVFDSMEYERIHKPSPQGGGLSPAKLRAMLMGGAEKRKKEHDEIESRFYFRSNSGSEIDSRRGSTSDECRDLDTVSGHTSSSSRVRSQDDESGDSEIGPPGFEFQKRAGGAQRPPLVSPFCKPAPSKWDDAQKWIASPGIGKHGVVGKKAGNRMPATKVVSEVLEEGEAKRVDVGRGKKGNGGKQGVDLVEEDSVHVSEVCVKPSVVLSRHDLSASVETATTFLNPPSTAKSVRMRDMGTEMTPIASQEPSRTGTPIRSTTPTRSPTSSWPSSPRITAPSANHVGSDACNGEIDKKQLSEEELVMKTRKEIMVLGTQLGKKNIAAWASEQQEEMVGSSSLKSVRQDQPSKSAYEMRAAAWEEAEKAKYLARFRREEVRIQAWEDHQKAKIEAETRKIEAYVERMRADAHERLMKKQAAVRHKAEQKHAAAEAKRNSQADKTAKRAEYIRSTGQLPSSVSCWSCCS